MTSQVEPQIKTVTRKSEKLSMGRIMLAQKAGRRAGQPRSYTCAHELPGAALYVSGAWYCDRAGRAAARGSGAGVELVGNQYRAAGIGAQCHSADSLRAAVLVSDGGQLAGVRRLVAAVC